MFLRSTRDRIAVAQAWCALAQLLPVGCQLNRVCLPLISSGDLMSVSCERASTEARMFLGWKVSVGTVG